MKISIMGTGYVGLVTGTCFAEMGNIVNCVDVDHGKIENLKKGIIPIYEPGLTELVLSNVEKGHLFFTTDNKAAIEKSDICFIAVGTPMGEDGSADLKYVLAVAESIGKYMVHDLIVVDKSTVPVGTGYLVKKTIQSELQRRNVKFNIEIVSNPEFLKEGNACDDFLKPDRIVIGADSEYAKEVMNDLYTPFIRNSDNFIVMDVKSAELTKYAANSMLATKISFINEISNICESVGADINMVRKGIGSDRRIGYQFIYPGCGYGGSCFPKDVQALIKTSSEYGYEAKVLKAVEAVNAEQKYVLVKKIINVFGDDLSGHVFAVWGLSFKPETDDMREAPAITLIKELVARGALIQAYDPKARREAEICYLKDIKSVSYAKSKYDVLNNADAMVLMTEWKEFRSPDFEEMGKRLKKKIIFDGRNQYKAKQLHSLGFSYHQIGVTSL